MFATDAINRRARNMNVEQVKSNLAKEESCPVSLRLSLTKWYKFVRVNGEYRFCEIEAQHAGLLEDGEIAESAGIIKIYPVSVKVGDYSMVLKLGPDQADYDNLPVIFGRPLEDW